MSALIFVSPLAVIAMVCLWLGFKGRIWLFVAWAVFWIAVTVIGVTYLASGASPVQVIVTMGGGMALFQISVYATGFLAKRAREWNVDND